MDATQVRELIAALREAEEMLALNEHTPPRDPDHYEAVRALGKQIGFGALMATAERAWRDVMAEDTSGRGGLPGGEFVSGPCRATHTKCLRKIRDALALIKE